MKRSITSSILLLLVCCLFPVLSFAQQALPADGKDFYLGYAYPTYNSNPPQAGRNVNGFFHVYALVSAYNDTKVKIAYFDNITGKEIITGVKSVPKRTAVQIELDRTMMTPSPKGD